MSVVNSVLRMPDMVADLLLYRQEMQEKKAAEEAVKKKTDGGETAQPATPAPSTKSTYTPPPAKDYRDILVMPGKRF